VKSENIKLFFEHHESRNDTDDVTPANADGKGINARQMWVLNVLIDVN
jgi:hypothetical protein